MEYRGEALSWRHSDPRILEVELHRAPLTRSGRARCESSSSSPATSPTAPARPARMILWSSRPGFCAGADLRELHAGMAERRSWLQRRMVGARSRLGPVGPAFARARPRGGEDRAAIRAAPVHRSDPRRVRRPRSGRARHHRGGPRGGVRGRLRARADRRSDRGRSHRAVLLPRAAPGPRAGLRRDPAAAARGGQRRGAGSAAERAQPQRRARPRDRAGLPARPRDGALDAARRLAEQAVRFERPATIAAKRLAKPLPAAALRAEKDAFCELVARPEVWASLERFVADEGVRPYLPAAGGSDGG